MAQAHLTFPSPLTAPAQLIDSALHVLAESEKRTGALSVAQLDALPEILTAPIEEQPVWSELCQRVAVEGTATRALEAILVTRQAALLEALALETPRRSVQRARIDALRSFAETRYSKAEGLYWQVLESSPGELSARVFLAEALIAQRLWLDAQDVLLGLMASREPDQATLAYAQALLHGFEIGLYQRLGPFP